jgi:hypothetical protein
MANKKFISKYDDNSEKPFTEVKHISDVVESGITDLGQRHRDHLVQKIVDDPKWKPSWIPAPGLH